MKGFGRFIACLESLERKKRAQKKKTLLNQVQSGHPCDTRRVFPCFACAKKKNNTKNVCQCMSYLQDSSSIFKSTSIVIACTEALACAACHRRTDPDHSAKADASARWYSSRPRAAPAISPGVTVLRRHRGMGAVPPRMVAQGRSVEAGEIDRCFSSGSIEMCR